MSLDGIIALPGDDISWLSIAEKEGEDYGYAKFMSEVDTLILGRKSYDKVLSMVGNFPPANTHTCYVITRQQRDTEGNVQFYNKPIVDLINHLKSEKGKNIYCDGGAEIVQLMMQENLIDEYIIFIAPILLGNGKQLFKGDTPLNKLKLLSSTSYETGMVCLHYDKPTNKV